MIGSDNVMIEVFTCFMCQLQLLIEKRNEREEKELWTLFLFQDRVRIIFNHGEKFIVLSLNPVKKKGQARLSRFGKIGVIILEITVTERERLLIEKCLLLRSTEGLNGFALFICSSLLFFFQLNESKILIGGRF